jgi:DNA-directed RNA polymerase II subunit RPB2
VKNLALMAYISVGCSKKPVIEFLDEFGVERLESINPRIVPNATKVTRTAAVG